MQIKDSNSLTKTEYVYMAVKEAILSGEYGPNEKIVIRSVAETFNMSDIPVREAMRKLEAEKLVSIVPHVGVVVNSISFKEIEEGVALREVFEPFAARLAAQKSKKEDIAVLNRLVARMQKCAEEDNYQMYGRLNKEFHETIYKLGGNDTLYTLIDELWQRTERLRSVFRSQPTRMIESNAEHKKLVEALAKGDADTAEQLIRNQRSLSTKRHLALMKAVQEGKGIK